MNLRPVAAVPFAQRTIEVWPVSLESAAAATSFSGLLSEDETARAGRFAFERDRHEYVAARAALRMLLASYLDERPEAIEFAYGERGKPRLAGSGSVRFNLSHKGGLALLAFSQDCELGVDVEALVPIDDRDAIAKRFFSAEEHAELSALPAPDRNLAFYRCWTRKEAYVKCIGDGLYAPLDRVRVTVSPGDDARVVALDGSEHDARAWTMHEIAVPPGYVGSLAYRDAGRPVRVQKTLPVAELLAVLSPITGEPARRAPRGPAS